jgi:hypothetical protein
MVRDGVLVHGRYGGGHQDGDGNNNDNINMFLLWHGRQKMQFQVGKGVRENEAALSNPYIGVSWDPGFFSVGWVILQYQVP